jgi:uncharacterized protein DUF2017
MRGPFSRNRDGSIEVRLADVEAQAVRQVAADILDELNDPGDAGLRRLFPPAYKDDRALESEFEKMTRDDLLTQKRAAARAVIDSIDSASTKRGRWTTSLDEDATNAWLAVLNDARLVLGTRLDVKDDVEHQPLPTEHPDAPQHDLYVYLSSLEWALVDILLEALPTTGID